MVDESAIYFFGGLCGHTGLCGHSGDGFMKKGKLLYWRMRGCSGDAGDKKLP